MLLRRTDNVCLKMESDELPSKQVILSTLMSIIVRDLLRISRIAKPSLLELVILLNRVDFIVLKVS